MTPDGRKLSVIPNPITMHHSRSLSFSMPSYHWHNGYEIYLFLGGRIRHSIEQQCYMPEPGTLCVIRPGELHRTEMLDDTIYERISIEIRSKYLDELSENITDLRECFLDRPLGEQCHVQLCEEDVLTFTLLAHKLMDHLKSNAYEQDALAKATLLELLVLTNSCFKNAERIRSGSEIPVPVMKTMQFIAEHLSDDLTLQAVGNAIHYDAGYLSRRFRETTGLTISRYIMYKRILTARKLLMDGIEPRNAAHQSGFRDYSVFYRSFVRLIGVSPSSFLPENNRGHRTNRT